MRRKLVLFMLPLSIAALFLSSYTLRTEEEISLLVPEGWPKPVYDFKKNPISPDGFQLGKKLFFDPMLSKDSTVSCSSCHLQYTNYTHIDHALSHGIKGLKGTRNTLSIINVAWSTSFMWDGGINNIEVQPLAPITNPVEMDNTLAVIVERLRQSESYKARFRKAFGDSAEITGQRVLKALAQFMVSIQSHNSKYDRVMRKEAGYAFTEAEQKGLKLFRKNCASCHKEPLFTNNGYEDNGLEVDPVLKDGGRIKITHDKKDSLKFKVPSLRNVEVSMPYMHDGRFRNLEMVLFHYANGIVKDRKISDKLSKAIKLEEVDKRNLLAFLKTLTDRDFLYDKRFRYAAE
ncbi:MAG: cytochrome-c peroxidase [Bacteroidia bacterium]